MYPPLPESRVGDDDQQTSVPMSPTGKSMARSNKAQSISPSESPSQAKGSKKNVGPPSGVGGSANGAELSPRSGSRLGLYNNSASEFMLLYVLRFGTFFFTWWKLHTFVYRDLIVTVLMLMGSVFLSPPLTPAHTL